MKKGKLYSWLIPSLMLAGAVALAADNLEQGFP